MRSMTNELGTSISWLALTALAAIGCSNADTDGGPEEPPPVAVAVAPLERVASCEEARELIRARALANMNARIDQLKQNPPQARPCFAASAPSGAQPGNAPMSPAPSTPTTPSSPTPASSTPAARDSSESASATSTTNNQVAGVDEADFIKNDSKYVYAAINGALRIIQAWPAAEAREIANVKLEGTPKKLFVAEDRALVYVSLPRTSTIPAPSAGGVPPRYASRGECSYGYDCQFGGDGTATAMLVFDISDRSAPKQLRRIDLSGSLLAARRIGTAVHTVVVTPQVEFPALSFNVASESSCSWTPAPKEQRDAELETLRAKNARLIANTPLDGILPTVSENGVPQSDVSCDMVYREREPTGAAFTSVVSLDMRANSAPVIATVVSKPGAVYASGEALYMAVIQDVPLASAPRVTATIPTSSTSTSTSTSTSSVDHASAIHKFRIGTDPKSSAYVASGKVKGHVLNQFSMDEHRGHLRVATSWGKVPNPNVHSTMSVLAQRENALAVVGLVDDIAPSEDIRSVRFDGDRGFIVTFKKTDPLYVFDLSEPAAPKITGELKIPGFSTYMHMLDDDHLLTIGYDAADQGNFAFFTGVLLQIFDVTDPENPTLAHKTVIGTRGSSSEALTNHLAFNLFQGKLAVPMTICEGGGQNGMYGTNMTFSGLMVFDVSLMNGVVERGRVAHPSVAGTYDSAGCSNWWTRASSVVQRSVFMDDFVYSISQNVIHIQNVGALGTDVASVPLNQ